MLHTMLFLVFPYVALALAVVGGLYRARHNTFTVSSLSSQLLERRKLYWGSVPFHYGVGIILLGHLTALFLPSTVRWWNGAPMRLYLLEITGLMLALWGLGGLLVLLWRRVTTRRIQVVSTPLDYVLLVLLLVSFVTGIMTATLYRFGSNWFTAVFTPYLASILTLRPRPELLSDLPWTIKLHVLNFFVLAALFPFSRLAHVVTIPFGYLVRPRQIVAFMKKGGAAPFPSRTAQGGLIALILFGVWAHSQRPPAAPATATATTPGTTPAAGIVPAAGTSASDNKVGADVYAANCAACHGAQGAGVPSAFPPLAGNPNLKTPETIVKAVTKGVTGAVTVNGQTFNGAMPPFAQLSDEQVAAVASYIRNSWGNSYGPVTAGQVKAGR